MHVMKRFTAIALATGAVAFALAGCGSDDSNSDAKTAGTSTTSASAPSPAAAPEAPSPTSEPPLSTAPAAAQYPDLGPSSATTCGEFKKLDSEQEKSVIEGAIAENPGSRFAGSPNVALGTAKLVCLSAGYAETPVAVAAGIIAGDK
jgi:hypothetical protein